MTREEAIEKLKKFDFVGSNEDIEFLTALEMGIKALEQETVSKESYDYEYFLRKEFELKIDRLEQQLSIVDKIKAEIEQLPTKTRTNWDGCCPDFDYPEIEYVDVSKNKLLSIIDKYRAESEE